MAKRPLEDRMAELKARLPKPVNYERIELQAHGPADVRIDQIRLLRGRVLVRPMKEVTSSILYIPDMGKATGKSLGHAEVVAMGPPMQTKSGFDVPHGFKVGDHVLHVGQHKSRDVDLTSETLRVIAQEEVQGVVEGDPENIDTRHGGKVSAGEVLEGLGIK